MGYIVKARFFAEGDNFGESYVVQSDNGACDLRMEIGERVILEPCKPPVSLESPGTVKQQPQPEMVRPLDRWDGALSTLCYWANQCVDKVNEMAHHIGRVR